MLHARNMNRISKYDDNGESCLSESIKKISFDKNIFIKIFLLSDYKNTTISRASIIIKKFNFMTVT